jgi:hypothetical protein
LIDVRCGREESEDQQDESKFLNSFPSLPDHLPFLPKAILFWVMLCAVIALPTLYAIEYGFVRGSLGHFLLFSALASLNALLMWFWIFPRWMDL